jgi:oligopeptide transport system substrate-binding protein
MQTSKKLRMKLLPACLAIIALLVAACGGGGSSTTTSGPVKAPASQQVLVLPEEGVPDIATFDPGLSTDLPSITAIDMVFTGLVQLNDNLQVEPQLAGCLGIPLRMA